LWIEPSPLVVNETSSATTVHNGPSDDAFTLAPVAAGQDWELNFRRTPTTSTNLTIDPLENITRAGSTATAPVLTDSTEESGELATMQIAAGGAESLNFYVIEVPDAIFVLFMDSGETYTPRAIHAGRSWTPFFTDGSVGDRYADGLGLHGHQPIFSNTTGGAGAWFSSNTTTSKIRTSQTTWHKAAIVMGPGVFMTTSDVNGVIRLRPGIVVAIDTDGATDNTIGFTKYSLAQKSQQSPGVMLDAGVGKDAWIHINETNAADYVTVPWDRAVAPLF